MATVGRIGSTPFGFGTPTAAGTPPSRVAVANWVNPITGDYEIDVDTGEFAQMPKTRQQVLLALTEVFGSSSARPGDGISLPAKIRKSFEREVADSVRQALRHLTEIQKSIRIDSITIDYSGSRAAPVVSFTDLTTGRSRTVSTKYATP